MNVLKLTFALWMFAFAAPLFADEEDGHAEEEGGHAEEESSVVEMTADERAAAGVITATVDRRGLSNQVRMPGEIVVNAYRSASVTTRVTAQVMKRHARLGDVVKPHQPLVTLSSVAMAEAQGALVIADREWQRVRGLGKAAVSERRYTEANIAQRQALSTVLAYGMTAEQAARLLTSDAAAVATGEFKLLAPQQGTVLSDDFVVGELIEPGRVLFDISDETSLWVEASVIPNDLVRFEVGAPARIVHGDEHWINGRVIQLHHQLDETTRRQGVRIEVSNTDDHLHPGQFVEAEISLGEGPKVLAIPTEAIALVKGKTTVFKLEEGHEFHPQVIEAGSSTGGWTEVLSGLSEGDELAVAGVFYVKSLLLKSSLGEGHGH